MNVALHPTRDTLHVISLCTGGGGLDPAAEPVADGWVMVPRVPTDEMLSAVWTLHQTNGRNIAEVVYDAMLAAAPPAPVADGPKERGIEAARDAYRSFCASGHPVDIVAAIITAYESAAAPTEAGR